MSVLIRNLAAGTLSNTTPALPGPAAGKSWIVKGIIITNRDGVARSIDIKVVNGVTIGTAGSIFIAPPQMAIPPLSTAVIDTEITLMNPQGAVSNLQGLSLALSATPTAGVDVVINGLERDV
jgi:hypothetical protein